MSPLRLACSQTARRRAHLSATGFSCMAVLFLLLNSPEFLHAQGPPQAASPPPGTISVRVDRVDVGVTVTGWHGDFVKGLRREDFHVFDDGAEQQISGFLPIEEPAQIVLMMESGPAALFLKKSELQAADAFLSSISPSDRVAIVSYSKVPSMVLGFTTDKTEVRSALHGMNFMAGFADLNLASSIAATLDWLSSLPGKKTLVLLSSGIDTSPIENWQFIQQKIRTSDVRILAVSVAGDLRKPAKKRGLSADERDDRKNVKTAFAEADQLLRELSTATGGRVYIPKNADQLNRAYLEIAQLVRHEYSLEFVPPSPDGRLHSVTVKVNRAWCHVDHRQAYLAPTPL